MANQRQNSPIIRLDLREIATLLLQVLQYISTAVWGLFALLRFRKQKKPVVAPVSV